MASPRRALIVIDVQQDYFGGPLEIAYPPREQSLANIGLAIETAVAAGIPVVAAQHVMPEGMPVFVEGTPGYELHPEIAKRLPEDTKRVQKQFGSVYANTDVTEWLRERDIDTVTIVGFMTNNCDLATSVESEGLGYAAEILSDASGAVNLANDAGSATAETVHTVLMTLLHSNFAAVATTEQWIAAVRDESALDKSNLIVSAMTGASATNA